MKLSNRQIREYLSADKDACRGRNGIAPAELIQKSKAAFYENQAREMLSQAEFLYQQGRYIRKYWWFLQAGVLLMLWGLLEATGSSAYTQRCMGVAAPLFAVLLLPEMWKDKSGGAEIECIAYYSLRQIYAARMFLFALVDFLLLCCFSMAMVLPGKMPAAELAVHFFLPYVVTCCICFRTLYSRLASETLALILCLVWCLVWNRLVMDERVYGVVSLPVWFMMLTIALVYLGYSIYKGQKNLKEIWEVWPIWN